MGIVLDEVRFQGRAPDLRRIADKITELSGLPVIVQESGADVVGNLYDLHAGVAFACAPQEKLEVFSYRPGAVKEFYEEFSQGIELPSARFMVGLNEPAGTQAVYLRSFAGQEPSLMAFTLLALEALGGGTRQPIPEEVRRQYAGPMTEAEFQERRRSLRKKLGLAALLYLLLLPITIPLFLLGLLVSLVNMPWRIGKAWLWVQGAIDKRDHQNLLRTIPDHMDFAPSQPADFPALDRRRLQDYSQALEALGFVHSLDYTLRTDVPLSAGGFGRLFFHPGQHCLAEVNQAFPANQEPSSMRCMMGSLLEAGWDLSTTDREPMLMSYAWRRPRNLWSCHPGHSPAELLTEHLQRRRQMMETLHLGVVTQLSAEGYFAYERQMMGLRKAVLKSNSMETVRRDMERFQRSPEHEWLGDFAHVAAGQQEDLARSD